MSFIGTTEVVPCYKAISIEFVSLKEGPGAKALLKALALFVRLKPHAPSGKAEIRSFINLAAFPYRKSHSAPAICISSRIDNAVVVGTLVPHRNVKGKRIV